MKKQKQPIVKKTQIEINYEDWIDSENNNTIIILHWWWWSSQSWLDMWELLFQSWYNVIVPDLPGFWKTKLEKTFDLEEYATVIEEFIKHRKLENIILWWHSNWWAIAVKIANRWKIKIDRLILNNSAWIRNDNKRCLKRKILNNMSNVVKKITEAIPPLTRGRLGGGFNKIRIFFYKLIWSHDYLEAEKNPYLKQTYLNMIKSDIKEEIKKIQQHTLLIRWGKDTYTPLSDWNYMRNNIKNSKMIVIENEKHWIHLHSPEKLVQTFLKNI